MFSSDLVWAKVFQKNFSKIRIVYNIEPKNMKKEGNHIKRRYLSAMSQVKDVNLQVFEAEDGHQYQIMIHGYLQKTPVHDDIVQIYGKHQDIFSFFNCHLFYEDKLSTVTLFSVPRFYERLHLLNKVDTILIAVNRYYPRTFDDLYKIAASAKELDLNKIMIVENVGLPDEMQIVELKKKEESTTTSNPEKKFTFDDV